MIIYKNEEAIDAGNGIFAIWERCISERFLKKRNHASVRELVWTLIPTYILLLIAVPSIELLYLMDVMLTSGPVFNYKIIGHQWYWTYDYFGIFYKRSLIINYSSDEDITFDSYMLSEDDVLKTKGLRLLEVDNSLIIPAYNNIHLLVTSADVLHSWAVPSLGVKIDAIPGRLNHICILLKRAGIFYGQCSEICGINHGFMPIRVEVFEV